MTATSRELARKRPAEIVPNRPAPLVIQGHTVRRIHPFQVAGWFALAVGVVLFAGLLLSLITTTA
jgi:hypothetical protein